MLLMSVLCWVAANASAQGRYTVEKASVVYVDNSGSTLSLSFADFGSRIRLELGTGGAVIVTDELSVYLDTNTKTYYALDKVTSDNYLTMFDCQSSVAGFHTPDTDLYYNMETRTRTVAGVECTVWTWLEGDAAAECSYGGAYGILFVERTAGNSTLEAVSYSTEVYDDAFAVPDDYTQITLAY